MEDLSLLPNGFIYSVIYLYRYGLLDIYFRVWFIIQNRVIYFVAQIFGSFSSMEMPWIGEAGVPVVDWRHRQGAGS